MESLDQKGIMKFLELLKDSGKEIKIQIKSMDCPTLNADEKPEYKWSVELYITGRDNPKLGYFNTSTKHFSMCDDTLSDIFKQLKRMLND